ncbi:MAG TPA: LuxR C-terminal-related transcriptional regulator [Nitriliruptorales bacterium]|nr:LuxR C-terminal-related transcriptional regulator [Nitriliruptorales bacterium]
MSRVVGPVGEGRVGYHDPVAAGREAFERRVWSDAYEHLRDAAEDHELEPDDLDRLATAAYLTGLSEAAEEALERLHHRLLDDGEVDRAARWAVWLAILLFLRGQHAQGGGWLSRAQRLLDDAGLDCAARGYLLVPTGLQALEAKQDPGRANAIFEEVSAIARRFDDPDLAVLGLLGSGQSLVEDGDVGRGVPLLDEVMVAVTTGDVSPVLAGLAYCAVIITCWKVFDLRRAQEWTAVLSRWCSDQQGLRPYRGQCLVHRSEIMQLHGEWAEAMEEIEQACAHLARTAGDPVMGMARYQQAELLRLRGQFSRAEESYRQASEWGHPPQPGLALLRLSEGRVDDAVAAIAREVTAAEDDRVRRARVLAAYVEIMLGADDVDAARAGVDALEAIAADFDSDYLEAVAAEGRGAVLLASGEPTRAAEVLREAWRAWRGLDAPYETARVRLLTARACRALGDHDTADMELDAARQVFQELKAVPALDQVNEVSNRPEQAAPGGLTPREVGVLQLVATGATNREVADTLVISEKTVARHLSNVYTKLGVGSRSAATAWAYEHDLA